MIYNKVTFCYVCETEELSFPLENYTHGQCYVSDEFESKEESVAGGWTTINERVYCPNCSEIKVWNMIEML